VTHYTSSTKDFTYLLSRFLARISA
jgi:hypothetical protein